jgi:hypothetical protein
VSRGKDFACRRLAQDPLAGFISAAPHIGGETDPVVVHIHSEGGGRRVHRQPACHVGHLGERVPQTTELLGDGDRQVAGLLQVVEVFLEESVLAVVRRCARANSLEQLLGQETVGAILHDTSVEAA